MRALGRKTFARRNVGARGQAWKSVLGSLGLGLVGLILVPRGAYALSACSLSITSCCAITSPGTYTIPGNFTATIGSGPCIDIRARDVTLNNANGNVTGPGSVTPTVGVMVEPTAPRATLNGCFIFCSGGVYGGFGTGLVVDGNAASVNFVGADNNGRGMLLNGAAPAVFISGANSNVGNGIVVNSTATAPLLSTVGATSNGASGIKLNQVSGALVESPTATGNGQYGIWLNGATGTSVTNPIADTNTIAGIFLGCSGTGPSTAPCAVPTRGNIVMSSISTSRTITVNGPSQKYGVVVDTGSRLNRVQLITAKSNTNDDMFDGNLNCDNNLWFINTFTTSNQGCIK
jgi:hypothetical protein